MAHRVISLPCGILSLSGYCGHRVAIKLDLWLRALIIWLDSQTKTSLGRPIILSSEPGQPAVARRVAADWHDGQHSGSRRSQISGLIRPVLFRQEGRIAIVTNAGWDVVDATASARN